MTTMEFNIPLDNNAAELGAMKLGKETGERGLIKERGIFSERRRDVLKLLGLFGLGVAIGRIDFGGSNSPVTEKSKDIKKKGIIIDDFLGDSDNLKKPLKKPETTVNVEFRNDDEFAMDSFPKIYQEEIKGWVAEYERHKASMEQLVRRSGPTLYAVKEIFKNKGVPEELVYLFFKESEWREDVASTFRNTDYGLGQINIGTALDKPMNMLISSSVNYYRAKDNGRGTNLYRGMYLFDQRRGVIDAANAVADYLVWLKGICYDSWVFAAWAYNRGIGHVKEFLDNSDEDLVKSIKEYLDDRRGKHGNVSYEYVGKILALMRVMRKQEKDHPEKFDKKSISGVAYRVPVAVAEVHLQRGQSLGHIASRYGISVRRLMRYNGISNSQLRRLRIGQKIKIPIEDRRLVTAGAIRKKLGMSMEEFYKWNSGILTPWTAISHVNNNYWFNYKLKKGETLEKIAKLYRKRGVSINDLRRDNSRSELKEGTLIMVRAKFCVHDSRVRRLSDSQAEERENLMPPLPNGWVIHVPKEYEERLKQVIAELQGN